MIIESGLSIIWIAAQIILMIALADLVAGTVHWAEDTLGDAGPHFWGKYFAQPNVTHHATPYTILNVHWLKSSAVPIVIALSITAVVIGLGSFTWQYAVFAIVGGMGQQVHRWSHTPAQQLPIAVRILQRLRIFQTAQQHWGHHRAPNRTHYCLITPWLNPVLDRLGYWRALEIVLVPVFGAPRVPELNQG